MFGNSTKFMSQNFNLCNTQSYIEIFLTCQGIISNPFFFINTETNIDQSYRGNISTFIVILSIFDISFDIKCNKKSEYRFKVVKTKAD